MLVNSIIFWIFFAIFLLPYFTLMRGSNKIQNLWLLAASYVFYGYADWRMCILLLIATITFYVLGLAINKRKETHLNPPCLGRTPYKDDYENNLNTKNTEEKGIGTDKRNSQKGEGVIDKKSLHFTRYTLLTPKTLVVLGVVLGAGMLLYFKYLNFFIEQFAALFGLFGLRTNFSSFNIIVPIGISFFTFKLIAYIVEGYKGNMEPCRDFVTFASYIAFFPTIMSGPIDSPKLLIPQMAKARSWNNNQVVEGMIRVLWGMFMKMSIADKVSPYTDAVFNNYYHHSGLTIAVAAVMYTFQIYTDFSGYSEMAIGTSQIMGFRVTENFMRPYFSQNVGDFWRRWHASLMNWFRDYIYFPLGGSRCSKARMYWNTMVVFMVSGLWHGANWTFIFWGAYHGLLVCFYKLTNKKKNRVLNTKNTEDKYITGSKQNTLKNVGANTKNTKDNTYKKKLETWNLTVLLMSFANKFETVHKYANILLVFALVTIGWMVFRCNSIGQFFGMLGALTAPGHFFASWALTAVLPIGILMLKELKDEEGWNLHLLHSKNWVVKAVSVALLIIFIVYMGELEGAKFIYFQF